MRPSLGVRWVTRTSNIYWNQWTPIHFTELPVLLHFSSYVFPCCGGPHKVALYLSCFCVTGSGAPMKAVITVLRPCRPIAVLHLAVLEPMGSPHFCKGSGSAELLRQCKCPAQNGAWVLKTWRAGSVICILSCSLLCDFVFGSGLTAISTLSHVHGEFCWCFLTALHFCFHPFPSLYLWIPPNSH